MMILSSSNTPSIRAAAHNFPQFVGRLITPRVHYQASFTPNAWWAADNDCFNPDNFHPRRFITMLCHHQSRNHRCLFVTAPDVVGNARATLKRFRHWEPALHNLGYPVALVAQDGLEHLTVPWSKFEALFIGGTTKWKLSPTAVDLARQAKRRAKWVHLGRVNSQKRFRFAFHIGADSIDGTTFGIATDKSLAWALPLLRALDAQTKLPII